MSHLEFCICVTILECKGFLLFAPVQAAFLDDGIARPPEVCVGITQMRQKSISRFLTLGITLSIAIVLVFLLDYGLGYLLHLHSLKKLGNLCPRLHATRKYTMQLRNILTQLNFQITVFSFLTLWITLSIGILLVLILGYR